MARTRPSLSTVAAHVKWAATAGMVVLVGGSLVACSGETREAPDDLAPMYVEEYQRLQEDPPSELVAEVVADFQVSDAEFTLVQQAFRECVEQQVPGSDPRTPPEGGSTVTVPEDFAAQFGGEADPETAALDALGKIVDDCGNQYLNGVEDLYLSPAINPWGYRTTGEALRACLTAYGSSFGKELSDEELYMTAFDESFEAPDEAVSACIPDPYAALLAKETG